MLKLYNDYKTKHDPITYQLIEEALQRLSDEDREELKDIYVYAERTRWHNYVHENTIEYSSHNNGNEKLNEVIDLILETTDKDLREQARHIYKIIIDQYEEETSIDAASEALEEEGEIYTASGKYIKVKS